MAWSLALTGGGTDGLTVSSSTQLIFSIASSIILGESRNDERVTSLQPNVEEAAVIENINCVGFLLLILLVATFSAYFLGRRR